MVPRVGAGCRGLVDVRIVNILEVGRGGACEKVPIEDLGKPVKARMLSEG